MGKKIKVTPLGGVGQIGSLNCMVYETDHEAIVVDCGSMFPDYETLGVDLIIPDFAYLRQIQHKLKALVLTHGHEDHAGATPFLVQEIPLPIYGTPFTIALIKRKLKEYPLPKTPKMHVFEPGDTLKIGSFEIETIFVNHSIIDSVALAIKTAAGTLAHVTDWKIDKTPLDGKESNLKKFSQLGKKGILALLSDSTNADQPGKTLSEKEVLTQIKKICQKHPGRIVITLFASNIQRIQGLARIAKNLGRTLALVGRSMHENTQLARDLGSLNFSGVNVVDVEETHHLKPNKVMILATGTQGETRSVLSRMAVNQFKPFKIQKGDLILFSSKIIPGNEKNIFNMINHLCRRGAQVIYESIHDIHTSGHAHQDELKTLVKRLKPKYFIPVHGEYRHLLKHAQLAEQWGVKNQNILMIENGKSLVFEKKKASVADGVPAGRVFVDGRGVGDVSEMVVRDRRHLSDMGIVICVLMIDRIHGEILRGPDLISRGFIEEDENPEILDGAKKVITDLLEAFNFEARTDMLEVQEEVRLALRRYFRRELDRKPVVIPVILEM